MAAPGTQRSQVQILPLGPKINAAVAQVVEFASYIREVEGSSPSSSTNFNYVKGINKCSKLAKK
jgi:hypothetical protein